MSARISEIIGVGVFLAFFHPDVFAAISFSISNPQAEADGITFDISVTGLTSSSCQNGVCYLQAVFTKPDTPRGFGFTKNKNGDWIEYNGSPETEYIATMFYSFTPQEGSWSGKLTAKANGSDPDYSGPGSYLMKALRYSGKSTSAAGESNSISVSVVWPTLSPTPTLTPPPTDTPTHTPTPLSSSNTPTSTSTVTGTSTPTETITPTDMMIDASDSGIIDDSTMSGEVLGEEEGEENSASVSAGKKSGDLFTGLFAALGAGTGLLGCAFVLYKGFFQKTV